METSTGSISKPCRTFLISPYISGEICTWYGFMFSSCFAFFKVPLKGSIMPKWNNCLTSDKAQLFDAVCLFEAVSRPFTSVIFVFQFNSWLHVYSKICKLTSAKFVYVNRHLSAKTPARWENVQVTFLAFVPQELPYKKKCPTLDRFFANEMPVKISTKVKNKTKKKEHRNVW